MNFACAGYGGNEGRLVPTTEATHFVEGEFEGCGHALAGHVARGENEFANGVNFQGALFEQVVADALVAGQENPAIGPNQREPSFIEGSGRKVGQVALEAHSELG